MKKIVSKGAKNAIAIGSLCSVSYLAVYFARNILGVVTPQMIEQGFTESYIGFVSSVYFVCYAIGQLINGAIGDKIKAKYMICFGLFMSGVANLLFSQISKTLPDMASVIYGFAGFFLSMIYGPMTKTVSENTEPLYTTRCSLGYTFASFIATPMVGLTAAVLGWQYVFGTGSAFLCGMAVIFFFICTVFEKKGLVKYGQYKKNKESGNSIKILIKRQIIKFTFIALITGVVRTTVVFWMPTYINQYLGFSVNESTTIFSATTLIISFTTFIAIFVYERLKRNMDLTVFIMFVTAAIFFALLYFIKHPVLNIVFMVIAIMASNGAACMLYSRYCPSLYDTGMVSTATGFLDFISYMAAAASSSLFANIVSDVGWGNLILIWLGLMVFGVVISVPYNKK